VSNARIPGHLVLALLCAPLLAGGACEKKKPADTGAITAMDRATTPAGPVDETPLPNVDVSKLTGDRLKSFYKLIGSLNSPCGKGHNLRTSFLQDTSCKRAPFAVKYVASLLADEQSEDQARQFYVDKYEKQQPKVTLDVSKAPRVGSEDAPVRIVEFFDYQCGHCQAFYPVLEKVAETHKGKVVEYFMMLPILEGRHPGSKSGAQAAIAAHAQGKFKEMHRKLFESGGALDKASVLRYAKELGLDVAKFEADYTAAAVQVASDEKQAETLGAHSTPTVYFNERLYEGPQHPDYIGLWIDEEIAVNR